MIEGITPTHNWRYNEFGTKPIISAEGLWKFGSLATSLGKPNCLYPYVKANKTFQEMTNCCISVNGRCGILREICSSYPEQIQESQGFSCILVWLPSRNLLSPSGISKDQSSYTLVNSRITGNLLYFCSLKRKTPLFLGRIPGRDRSFILTKSSITVFSTCTAPQRVSVLLLSESLYYPPESLNANLQQVLVQLFSESLGRCLTFPVVPQLLSVYHAFITKYSCISVTYHLCIHMHSFLLYCGSS